MTLLEAAQADLDLRQRGHDYWGCCPFHAEETPSFSIIMRGDKQRYYCFGCQAKGDVVDYLVRRRGLAIGDAMRQAGHDQGTDAAWEQRRRQAREAVLQRFADWKREQRKMLTTLHDQVYLAEMAYRSICRAPQVWPVDEQEYWIAYLGDLYHAVEVARYETDVLVTDRGAAWAWWRAA